LRRAALASTTFFIVLTLSIRASAGNRNPDWCTAARDKWNIDLEHSLLLGDSECDEILAAACGVPFLRVDGCGKLEKHEFSDQYKAALIDTIDRIDTGLVEQAIEWFREARAKKATIFVCGNGGSASTASHFACDIVKGASFKRDERFRIMALTDSLPTLTAYSNDVSYECVFAEQFEKFCRSRRSGDVHQRSGNSPNVLRAMEYANSIGCKTIALTGRDGGKLRRSRSSIFRYPCRTWAASKTAT